MIDKNAKMSSKALVKGNKYYKNFKKNNKQKDKDKATFWYNLSNIYREKAINNTPQNKTTNINFNFNKSNSKQTKLFSENKTNIRNTPKRD